MYRYAHRYCFNKHFKKYDQTSLYYNQTVFDTKFWILRIMPIYFSFDAQKYIKI